MNANTLLSQQLELVKADLKKSRSHKSDANQPRNKKSILGSKGSVLSPICAYRMMVKRQDADSKKLKRLQAKHAKELAAQQRAQEARDLIEAEHEASMAARDSIGASLYIDSHGVTCK
jgi:hypothetical protein